MSKPLDRETDSRRPAVLVGGSGAPPQPVERADREARRRLLRAMRSEMLPAVEAIVGHTQMLREDAADRPSEMLEDLDKLLHCTGELYEFIKETIRGNWPEIKTHEFDARLRKTRHDIGNRLNHALGYCQFLIMDEKEHYFEKFLPDLEAIQRLCKNCEKLLPGYQSPDASPELDPVTDSTPSIFSAVIPHYSTAPAEALLKPATILVVDDSTYTCELLAKFLQREKHTVCTSPDGEAALNLLHEREFDLVLLDFMMPGMNGFEVLRRIKESERLRHTPVIMISALDSVDDMVPCIESGADDFLTKPVDFSLLKARVNASLERIRLREREFGQFFSPEIARYVMRNPEIVREGREYDVTVLFCDIRNFSRISEPLHPSETVRWLSDVMDQFTQCVRNHRGVPVNYIGDELMAMWGAPEEAENHAELACRAAFEILSRLPEINQRWEPVLGERTEVGIGINSGLARVGDTGAGHKFNYGPLGANVNLASRVQGATKYLRSRLLITDETWRRLNGRFPARRLCHVRAVNISEEVDLYELLPEGDPVMQRLRKRYEVALELFERQDVPEEERLPKAAAILGDLLVDNPDDGPSLQLMSRVVHRLLHPAGEFNPVWDLPGK